MRSGSRGQRRILLDARDHLHCVRTTELGILLDRCGRYFAPPILEVGAGDGLQSRILASRFGRVVATDVDASRFVAHDVPFVRTSGEDLPFRDASFATVFSSSVLEHVPRLDRALLEMARVLAPGGYVVHVVPTRFWQAATIGLRLPYMLARRAYGLVWQVLARLEGHAVGREKWERWWYAGHDIQWGRIWDVPVHGVSSSHLEEWRAFGRARWVERFHAAGLRVVRTVDLYAYSPYGFFAGAERWRRALSELGFPAVRAFVLAPAGTPGARRST